MSGYPVRSSKDKIVSRDQMVMIREQLRQDGKNVVFTNGCFDIMHAGHVSYLRFARKQGDVLILGLNSDASVRRNKGDKRPIISEQNRAEVLAALEIIDYVVMFDDDEPAALIGDILPDVLVKAEDWAHYVSGRDVVEKHGGKVVLAPLVEGLSTTAIIEKIIEVYNSGD